MIGARSTRRFLAGWLPAWIKRPAQRRLIGFRPSAVDLPVAFTADADGPKVRIAERATLRYRPDDHVELEDMLRTNGSCVEEIASFLLLAGGARVLFDVGAAKGVFSIVFCLLNRDARAFAFEPSQPLADAAASLAAMNDCTPRMAIERAAVGREPGRHSGRLDPWGYVAVDGDAAGGQRIEFDVTTIDRASEQLGVEPDLIKIDVEGYELEVLAGASRVLERGRPPICLELHLDLLEQRGTAPMAVLDELSRHRYRLQSCVGRPLNAASVVRSPSAVVRLVALPF